MEDATATVSMIPPLLLLLPRPPPPLLFFVAVLVSPIGSTGIGRPAVDVGANDDDDADDGICIPEVSTASATTVGGGGACCCWGGGDDIVVLPLPKLSPLPPLPTSTTSFLLSRAWSSLITLRASKGEVGTSVPSSVLSSS